MHSKAMHNSQQISSKQNNQSKLVAFSQAMPKLPWEVAPLKLLSPARQVQFKHQAKTYSYKLGEKIWSTHKPGDIYVIIQGKVRLKEAGQSKSLAILTTGEWFGDLLELSGDFKAVAASREVQVVRWTAELWQQVINPDIEKFWLKQQSRYQERSVPTSYAVDGYPFIASLNTAAACLTMAAIHLESPARLDIVQRQVKGQGARQVTATAEKMGVKLRKLSISWQDLHQLSFPALINWRQEHWVIVYEIKGNRLIIADPLNPNQTCESIPQTILEESWDGQLWQIEPIQKQEKFGLSWFLPAIWRYRRLLIEILIASFTLQILGLGSPVLTQVIIDKAMVQQSVSTLDVMLVGLVCIAIFEAVLGMLRIYTFTHTARRIDLSLSSQVFRHLMQLPLAYFEARRVGDTVARVQEMNNIRDFLTGTTLTVILDSIFVVVYLALMVYYNITLTLAALAVIPFFSILILVSTPIIRKWLNESFNRNADRQSFLVETITGIHAVKAHTAERTSRERWEGLLARYVRTDFKAATASNITGHISTFFTSLSYLIILGVGAHLAIQQKLTVGELVAFQMLSGRVTSPILRLIQLWQNLQEVLLSVDRLGDILNSNPESVSGLALPAIEGKIGFDNVVFRYRDDREPILRGVSFEIEPGMFVGIVGRSGSGKSTLSKLLQGLYQPESGRISIDGYDVKIADLNSLREQISVVLQDDYLFNSSVLENITLSNPETPPAQIIQAAKLAAAHNFISELPQGYETNVGERGMALSGGQRQRVALARMFLSQAPILILDEATSALDSETEQMVLRNLKSIADDRTLLMIAHRFEPLKRADLILVMDKGVLVEQGTHAELIAKQGLYWSLYQRQHSSV